MTTLNVPSGFQLYPVKDLPCGAQTRNALIREGYSVLGHLDGVAAWELASVKGIGEARLEEFLTSYYEVITEAQESWPDGDRQRGSSGEVEEKRWRIGQFRLPEGLVERIERLGIESSRELLLLRLLGPERFGGSDLEVLGELDAFLVEYIKLSHWSLQLGSGLLGIRNIEEVRSRNFDLVRLLPRVVEEDAARNSRDFRIICARYQLQESAWTTLESLGTEFGVSRERVRQLETKVRDRLSAILYGDDSGAANIERAYRVAYEVVAIIQSLRVLADEQDNIHGGAFVHALEIRYGRSIAADEHGAVCLLLEALGFQKEKDTIGNKEVTVDGIWVRSHQLRPPTHSLVDPIEEHHLKASGRLAARLAKCRQAMERVEGVGERLESIASANRRMFEVYYSLSRAIQDLEEMVNSSPASGGVTRGSRESVDERIAEIRKGLDDLMDELALVSVKVRE